ncbi:hypothetical protein [Allofournierella massiliensis]|uniref:hypothetical protein n=1 Tax=Allofournierella massiliensis TaxID=1650663 RepID=UPI0025A3C910|nr:hypothetical protein [Fournierella massiliensis]
MKREMSTAFFTFFHFFRTRFSALFFLAAKAQTCYNEKNKLRLPCRLFAARLREGKLP